MRMELIKLSEKELLNLLTNKNEQESYKVTNEVFEIIEKSDVFYPYFDGFLSLVEGRTSFMRMRGFTFCIALAKYDTENKIEKALPTLLSLLKDDKPTTVRVCLSSIKNLVEIKPNLKKEILPYLDTIDLGKYKESMSHLIAKDIAELKDLLSR